VTPESADYNHAIKKIREEKMTAPAPDFDDPDFDDPDFDDPDFDAIVIGAGFSGIHMLKSLRDRLGLKARVYEAGDTVGGTLPGHVLQPGSQ
jgi:ribulose 1,5-bisphosphate synthetase/thiazole synthase